MLLGLNKQHSYTFYEVHRRSRDSYLVTRNISKTRLLICGSVPVPCAIVVSSFWDLQYIPRNMHTVLLCFALLWLCNRS